MMHSSLVVGVNGIIGSALFKRLRSRNVSVVGTTQRIHLKDDGVFYLNLLDPPNLWKFPKDKFDVAYICAAISRMASCEDDPTKSRQVNVIGMKNLVRHLIDTGTFVIFLSTNQIFSGNSPYVPANAPCNPMNEYGRQKSEAEEDIQSYLDHWAIIRLTKVMEPDMPLLKQWVEKLEANHPIEAFEDMMLAPVSLRQVIDTLILIAEKKQSGVYQLSGAKDISYLTMAHYLTDHLKRAKNLVHPTSATDKGIKKIFLPRFTTLDCSSTIALSPQKPPTFAEVIKECIKM